MRLTPLLLLLTFLTLPAQAKVFQNQYISFDVPDSWNCVQEQLAWVCRPTTGPELREGIIILAAKEAGPEDQLPNYLNTLKQAKTLRTQSGLVATSKVESAGERNIGQQKWIEALHLGSEVPDYHTLYLATVKDHLAILLTFSAHRPAAERFNPVFRQAVASLKITASQQLLMGSGGGSAADIGIPASELSDPANPQTPDSLPSHFSGFTLVYILSGLLLVVIAALLYFLRR